MDSSITSITDSIRWLGRARILCKGLSVENYLARKLLKQSADLTSDFMMYIVVPSLVEGYVAEAVLTGDWDDKTWGEFIAHSMIHTVSASIPLVRDVVHAVTSGHDPAAGLLWASYKGITDFTRQIGKEEIDVGKGYSGWKYFAWVMFADCLVLSFGQWQKFMYNYTTGAEDQPETMEDWYRSIQIRGTTA